MEKAVDVGQVMFQQRLGTEQIGAGFSLSLCDGSNGESTTLHQIPLLGQRSLVDG